jgi:cyclohexanecarboxylate-CoA ligase
MTTSLPELVAQRAAGLQDDVPAVIEVRVEATRTFTWRQLDTLAGRIAAFLSDIGVEPGEHVAFQLPNRIEFVALSVAILRIGAVCCPLMPILRARELTTMLRRARARVIFAPQEFRGRRYLEELCEIADDVPSLQHVIGIPFQKLAEASTKDARPSAPHADAIAQLLFTSGTSGEPKGVLHRGDVLTQAARMEIEHLGLGEKDRVFIPSPLAHQTGFLYGMWLAIVLGVPQILMDEWDGRRAIEALNAWGGTFVQAATPFLADMTRAVEDGYARPRSLRIFVPTGATVPRALAQRAATVLGAAICGAFGTTEGCLATLAAPTDPPHRACGTDGRPLPGIRIRVTSDVGAVLSAGTEGNYEIRSPTMFAGYLDDPASTTAAYTPDGWYRTGDLAIVDEDGYLRISGRVKDVINRGGEKIPVMEIEQILYAHPSIREIAIVAMPDERLGERACAFVVLEKGERIDFPDMQRYLQVNGVAKQYWPERLEVVGSLPKTASGKVQKYVLREQAKGLRPTRVQEGTAV